MRGVRLSGSFALRFHHIYGSLRNPVRTFRMTCRKSSQRVVHAVPRRPWRDGFRRRGRLPAPIVPCRPKDKAWRGSVAPCGCHLILPSNWTHCISQDSHPWFGHGKKTAFVLRRAAFLQDFHGIGAVKHCLKFIPTSPDGLPTGWMISLSVLMSPEASEGVIEGMD